MLKIIFMFLGIISLFVSVSHASERCQKTQSRVPIEMNLSYGNVEYLNNVRSSNFQSFLHKETGYRPQLTEMVRGVTFAASSIGVQSNGKVRQFSPNSYCVELESVKVNFGYDRVIVLIDRAYRPGSCQYRVVKEHEDTHVFLNRDTLRFYSKYVHDEAYKIAQKIMPRPAGSAAEAKKVLEEMTAEIQNAVLPINDFFMKIKEEENLKIDTPESYAKTTRLCKSW